MKRFLLIAAAPMLVAAGPAVDIETKKDVRCFVSLSAAAASADKEMLTSLAIVSQYYLGRIDARAPTLDLEEAMATEAKTITNDEINALIKSCSEAVGKRGEQIKEIGARLQKRGI